MGKRYAVLGGGGSFGIMHHKYAVFDGVRMETGSYNWTVSANRSNHENADFMADRAKIATFQSNFERLWLLAYR